MYSIQMKPDNFSQEELEKINKQYKVNEKELKKIYSLLKKRDYSIDETI